MPLTISEGRWDAASLYIRDQWQFGLVYNNKSNVFSKITLIYFMCTLACHLLFLFLIYFWSLPLCFIQLVWLNKARRLLLLAVVKFISEGSSLLTSSAS